MTVAKNVAGWSGRSARRARCQVTTYVCNISYTLHVPGTRPTHDALPSDHLRATPPATQTITTRQQLAAPTRCPLATRPLPCDRHQRPTGPSKDKSGQIKIHTLSSVSLLTRKRNPRLVNFLLSISSVTSLIAHSNVIQIQASGRRLARTSSKQKPSSHRQAELTDRSGWS